jgi:hypothetical protein
MQQFDSATTTMKANNDRLILFMDANENTMNGPLHSYELIPVQMI